MTAITFEGQPSSDLLQIRKQSGIILQLAQEKALKAYHYHPEKISEVARYVIETTEQRYPDGLVPPHSRWRHFEAGDKNRWATLRKAIPAEESLKIATELTILAVLLDAGAGADWRYTENDGSTYTRSEGLGVASFHLFNQHFASGDAPGITANRLKNLTLDAFRDAFQVSGQNPLIGTRERWQLLQDLASQLANNPSIFGAEGRLGNLAETLLNKNQIDLIHAFNCLLDLLTPVWPERPGQNVAEGDVWYYTTDQVDIRLPFHKLTQWMLYSLAECWQMHDIEVLNSNLLTALPEYRNGGLLIDMEVLIPVDPEFHYKEFSPESNEVLELRAMTVATVDLIADSIRSQMGADATNLSLAQILEGGTWFAGRKIAREKRSDSSPPIRYQADGTLF